MEKRKIASFGNGFKLVLVLFLLSASLSVLVFIKYKTCKDEFQLKSINISNVLQKKIALLEPSSSVSYRFDEFIYYTDWDHVCVIKPYALQEEIIEETGVKYRPLGIDTHWSVLLIGDGFIKKEVLIPYTSFDAVEIESVACFSKIKSHFKIQLYDYTKNIKRIGIYFGGWQ